MMYILPPLKASFISGVSCSVIMPGMNGCYQRPKETTFIIDFSSL